MFFLILITLCEASLFSWAPPIWDDTCGFTREDATKCLESVMDSDKNGIITQDEIKVALHKHVPLVFKPFLKLVNMHTIMRDCDYNHDGIFTPDDFLKSHKDCAAKQKNLCTIQWFCKRAKEQIIKE